MRRIAATACLALIAVLLPASPAAAEGCVISTPSFPGSEETVRCVVVNNGSRDASFYQYIRQDSITVLDENDVDQTNTPEGQEFLGFFRLSLATQTILTASTPTDGEEDDLDVLAVPETFRTTCDEVPLTQLTGNLSDPATYCDIGRARRADYTGNLVQNFSERAFEVTIHFLDVGDQSAFAGWAIVFTTVFGGRIPAASDCDGPCLPVYTR